MSKQRRRFSLVSLTFSSWIKRTGKTTSSPAVPLQVPVPRPAAADPNAWHAYWQAQGQSWRTEPEIATKRQRELSQRLAIAPNIKQGIYPFKDIKLSRADVEWLLATHENGRGPVDWDDKTQRERQGLDVRGADLRQVDLRHLPLARLCGGLTWDERRQLTEEQSNWAVVLLEGADLSGSSLEGALLNRVRLKGAFLQEAKLEGATLSRGHLEEVTLALAQLQGALLIRTQLKGSTLARADLRGADLRGAQLGEVNLNDAILGDEKGVGPQVADVQWENANLTDLEWSRIHMLGDEYKARQKMQGRAVKDKSTRLGEYKRAVRANRQLAVALQAQGLNEDAARFAYRAQVLQRKVLWFQMAQPSVRFKQRMQALGAWFFSWFLFLIAGYGYRPGRSFLAYLLVISGFATAYYLLGHTVGPTLSPLGAFVFSMTSFHGRGFFPGSNISLEDPLTVLAAFEALVGLIIEVTFIATLTQRFFNR